MEIYQLTALGDSLANNYRAPRKETWLVLYFLKRRGAATKEQILENVPNAGWYTLAKLKRKGLIEVIGRRVAV